MNLLLFLITFNLLLISRLRLTFRDDAIDGKSLAKMSVIPLFSLPILEIGTAWYFLMGYMVVAPLVMYLLEHKGRNLYLNRLRVLGLHAIVLAILFSPAVDMKLANYIQLILERNGIDNPFQLLIVQAFLFGGLLVMNEMNVALRYLMKMLNLTEIGKSTSEDNISAKEYNTGRVIGMIERLLIYTFTLSGQFAAIGFVLTAKGIVRYREFEDRTFAEYVLIGTLLSALLAMGSAFLVKLLL